MHCGRRCSHFRNCDDKMRRTGRSCACCVFMFLTIHFTIYVCHDFFFLPSHPLFACYFAQLSRVISTLYIVRFCSGIEDFVCTVLFKSDECYFCSIYHWFPCFPNAFSLIFARQTYMFCSTASFISRSIMGTGNANECCFSSIKPFERNAYMTAGFLGVRELLQSLVNS